jgi:cytochrome oxidase assembly protein ShyY1
MLALLRTRRWIGFTTLVVVLIAAFGFLSHWQWMRADEKRAQRLLVERSTAGQSPVPVIEGAVGDIPEWEVVSATGVFDESRQVLVRQRPQGGANGYWVLTPLSAEGGLVTWVNRGWLAATGPAIKTPDSPPPPSGVTEVTGWWRMPETVSESSRTGLPIGMIGAVDPSVLPGTTSMTGYIQLVSSSPEGAELIPVPRPTIDEGQNISYAVQWILFAAVGIIGWFIFLRRESIEDAERASVAASEAKPEAATR